MHFQNTKYDITDYFTRSVEIVDMFDNTSNILIKDILSNEYIHRENVVSRGLIDNMIYIRHGNDSDIFHTYNYIILPGEFSNSINFSMYRDCPFRTPRVLSSLSPDEFISKFDDMNSNIKLNPIKELMFSSICGVCLDVIDDYDDEYNDIVERVESIKNSIGDGYSVLETLCEYNIIEEMHEELEILLKQVINEIAKPNTNYNFSIYDGRIKVENLNN
jgi:hypothetical protein